MNVVDTALVPCPACVSGYKTVHSVWGKDRRVRCLACASTPGQVEAHRICTSCGRFKDMCRCGLPHKTISLVKLVKLPPPPPEMEAQPEEIEIVQSTQAQSEDRVRGVSPNKAHGTWNAYISRDGKQHNLGEFKDRNLAIDIRAEAEALPTEAFEALKARYRMLRRGEAAPDVTALMTAPTVESVAPAPVEHSTDGHLADLIQAAKTADADVSRLRTIAYEACETVTRAEQEAIIAWNRVADAIAESAGEESALQYSRLRVAAAHE